MANKILLCISSAQTVAAHWQGGRLQRCEVYPPDEDGLAAFGEFLKSTGRALAYVAADTVEEDYRFETLPHATGSDRASLLERKMRQYYRGTRFVSALPRGRTGDKRRDDRYLFSALTNPALVDPWLAAIAAHGSPVAGVYLASMLTAALLPRLNITLPRVLVAAPHRSGLRLTFYRDGEFCTSRLTRVIPDDSRDAAHRLATELAHTRMYLSTLNLDTIDEPLPVVFLDRDDTLAPLVKQIGRETEAQAQGLECVCIDRATLTRQLQISPQHLDLALETIYLRLMADQPPPANLAPTTITAGYRLFQRKAALYAASAAVGVAGVAWTAYNLWHSHDLNQQSGDAARRTATAQAQYKEITRTFPAAPTSSDNLIKAVTIYQQVVKSVRSPQPFMQMVSRAIEPSPEIFLQEIAWHYGTERPEAATANLPARNVNVKPAAAPDAGGLWQSGTLTGEIRPFQGDFRAAIASIQRVARRLEQDPAVAEVKVIKLPLNVNPELALSGNTRDVTDQPGTAEFKIAIWLKPDA
jgi:hypothetical protein